MMHCKSKRYFLRYCFYPIQPNKSFSFTVSSQSWPCIPIIKVFPSLLRRTLDKVRRCGNEEKKKRGLTLVTGRIPFPATGSGWTFFFFKREKIHNPTARMDKNYVIQPSSSARIATPPHRCKSFHRRKKSPTMLGIGCWNRWRSTSCRNISRTPGYPIDCDPECEHAA